MSDYKKIDVHGLPISIESERKSEVFLNMSSAFCGVFSAFCGGGAIIFTLFMKEWLNASASTIGLIISLTIGMPTLGLLGAQIVERLGRRKPYMVICNAIMRMPFIFVALIPLLGQSEKAQHLGIVIIFAVVLISRSAVGLSGPAWWSWAGDLVPKERVSRFFAQQQRFIFTAAIITFLMIAIFFDQLGGMKNKMLVISALSIGVLAGTIETMLLLFVTEPKMVRTKLTNIRESLVAMIEPFRHSAFRRLILIIGLYNFLLQLTMPFLSLYLKGTQIGGHYLGIGASYRFLVILPMITSIIGLFSTKLWGVLGDKLGSKMLLLMGTFYWFPFLVYFVITPENYAVIIIIAIALGSFLQPTWAVGMNSAILQISPQANRSSYGAAYLACNLAMMAPAPYIGGLLADKFAVTEWTMPNGMPFCYVHVLAVITSIGMFVVIISMNRIPISGHRPWKEIFATLFDMRLLHTLAAMRTIGRCTDADRLTKALKQLSGIASRMAIKEVVQLIDNENPIVSQEAAFALCRMGLPEDINRLVQELHPEQIELHKKIITAINHAQSTLAVESDYNLKG